MIKQTVVFKNFLGEERTEVNWFHVTKAKVLTSDDKTYTNIVSLGRELEAKAKVVDQARDKIDESDPFDSNALIVADAARSMAKLLDIVITMSYGILSEDGNNFVQNDKELEKFKSSAAYAAMIEQFMEDPDQLTAFVDQVLKV